MSIFFYMDEALKEAKIAYLKNEVPVGAVIVFKKEIIARAHNIKLKKKCCIYHAEIEAIRKASQKLGTFILDECELYVTLEPCLMCAGAIIQSRIKRLYFGAFDKKAGACGSILDVFNRNYFKHNTEVYSEIQYKESENLLKKFFENLRRDG